MSNNLPSNIIEEFAMKPAGEDETKSIDANNAQITDSATIHLSERGDKFVSEVHQIIFHKMADGLFIEVYMSKELEKYLLRTQFSLDNAATKKLIEFLNNPKTY